MCQGTKRCSTCKETKTLDNFWKRSSESDGIDYRCKDCHRRMKAAVFQKNYHGNPEWRERHLERSRKKYATDPLYARKMSLKSQYGITLEDYDAKLAEQGGVCAVCGKAPSARRRLAVDHDHKTGEVRGLLCTQCNQALGLLKDSHRVVKSLLKYITSFSSVADINTE